MMKRYWVLSLLFGSIVVSGDSYASVKDRIKNWNEGAYATKPMEKTEVKVGKLSKDRLKAVETPKEAAPKAQMEVGNELGKITKNCETKTQGEYYNKALTRCNAAKQAGGKEWSDFYKDYEDRWDRGLHALTAKRSIKTANDARQKGTPINKLNNNNDCADFADQMSTVHPSNNDVFEETMQCVASQRANSGYSK